MRMELPGENMGDPLCTPLSILEGTLEPCSGRDASLHVYSQFWPQRKTPRRWAGPPRDPPAPSSPVVATLEAACGDGGFPVQREPDSRVTRYRRTAVKRPENASRRQGGGSAVLLGSGALSLQHGPAHFDKYTYVQVQTDFRQTIKMVSM